MTVAPFSIRTAHLSVADRSARTDGRRHRQAVRDLRSPTIFVIQGWPKIGDVGESLRKALLHWTRALLAGGKCVVRRLPMRTVPRSLLLRHQNYTA